MIPKFWTEDIAQDIDQAWAATAICKWFCWISVVLEFFLLPRGFINDSFVWPLNNLHFCEIKGISPQMFGWLNFFNWSRPLNNPSNAQEPSSLMNKNSWIGELIKWQDWWLISILQLFGKLISNLPNVSLIGVLVPP